MGVADAMIKAKIEDLYVGWSFETFLEKCDIDIDEEGEPIIA